MNEAYDFDVAVLGGGPAGSSAAATLAAAGWRVRLFERERFPRFHIGESLLATANEFLDILGAHDAVRAAGFTRKWGATLLGPDGAVERYADFSSAYDIPQPETYQVPRQDFDQILLEHARKRGAVILEEHRVVAVDFDENGVTLSFHDPAREVRTARARAVIDASGRASVLARKFDLRQDEPRLANISVFAHYSGVPRLAGRRSGDIRIVARNDMGWFWLIPIAEDLMSVGVVLPRAVFDRLPRMEHEELLLHTIAETPVVAGLMKKAQREWPVRVEKDFSYSARAYAGDRWLLAGDAGSFLDPVFSTGVNIALESGIEAAQAIDEGLRRGDLSARRFRRYSRRQSQRYRAFRRFVLAFYTPNFRDLFFQPDAPAMFFNAVVTVLAGRWRPSWSTRLLIRIFFFLVWVQRHIALAPRVWTALEAGEAK